MNDLVVLMGAFLVPRFVTRVLQLATGRGTRPTRPVRQYVDPCLGPVTGLPPRPLPTAEDVLQARLLGGAMSREDYRGAMARLAVDDERSHPVSPP